MLINGNSQPHGKPSGDKSLHQNPAARPEILGPISDPELKHKSIEINVRAAKNRLGSVLAYLICIFLLSTSVIAQEDPYVPVTDIFKPSDSASLVDLTKANSIGDVLSLSTVSQPNLPNSPKVAVIGSCNNVTWRNDVVNKLSATGLFSQIDGYDGTYSMPSLATLQQYDAVLVYSDCGFQNNVTMGNTLADYADSGGGVVLSTFVFWNQNALGLQGRIVNGGYLPFTQGQQNGGFDLSMVKDNPSHPILSGVNTFLGGQSSYHNNPITVAPGASLIAHWSNGQPLVGTKETNGHRVVGLNFYPPSDAARSDMWRSNTDGGLLMGNALLWAANNHCSNPNALLIYDTNNSNTQALKTALQNAGINVTLSQTPEYQYNGTNPSPVGFNVVIHMNGSTPYNDMPLAGQQALVSFVQNGGGYIGGAWNTFELQYDGGLQQMRDLVLLTNYVGAVEPLTMTDVPAQSSHPILANIPSPLNLSSISFERGNAYPFASNPVTVLMTSQYNTPILAVRDFGQGHVVHFGIAPNWIGGDTSLSNPNIQQIYIDSVKWASGPCSVSNTAPVAAADSFSTNEDTPISVPATGVLDNDSDADNNALTAVLVSGPANASSFVLNSDGSFSYSPTPNFNGQDSFTYKANDGQADSNVVTVTITVNEVNDAPSLAGVPGSATIDELSAYGFTAAANDIDVPAQTLTFSLVGAPTGAAIDPGTGQFSWTPTEAQGPGSYNFAVRVSDGVDSTDANVTITVNEVNAAPTLSNVPASATIDELTAYTFTASASDSDVPVQTLTFSLVGAPSGATINPSTGAFSWTPSEAQGNGSTYSFAVRVSDGVVNTDSPIALTVREVNSAPSIAAISDQTIDELTQLSVTANGTDPDDPANTLTYSLDTGSPTGMTIDPATGAISWTPTELQGEGDYTVTARATDNGTPSLSGTATFKVHVNEVNVAPELAAIGNKTIDEQVAFSFNATATDADLKTDNTPANNLTYSLVGAPSGASITPGGAFSWTPDESQGPGSYTFTVKVTDDGSPAMSDEESITVTVREVNIKPTLSNVPASLTGYWGNAYIFAATATDPDIPANTLTFNLIGAPAGAAIDPSTGAFAWTPAGSQQGSFTFTVRVTDNGSPALRDDKSITINVGKRPTAIVYTGDGSEQYSDKQVLTATLTDNGGGAMQGILLSGKSVRFDIGSQNTSVSTDSSGVASTDLVLSQDPASSYNVVSSFAGDALYVSTTDTDAFDITQEDARVYYTGMDFVNTSCATCGTAATTLSATIRDITAETSDSATDPFAGDIRNAKVTFVDRDASNAPIAGCVNIPVQLVASSDTKTGTVTCNWSANIGSADSDSFTIGIVVGNYYSRDAGIDDVVVTVSKPLGTNFITGGGYLKLTENSVGQFAGGVGLKNNFGFNVKYNKSGKSLQGKVNVIVRGSDGRVYQIKCNSMDTLTVNNANPLAATAVFTAKASLTDITDPLAPISLGGGHSFQMKMTDRGEPGTGDTIGITLYANGSGAVLFSSNWNGTSTIEQLLGGGNLQVR